MPRRDDDIEDEDERPRRRPPRRDDIDDEPPRARRPRNRDDDEEPPIRSRRRNFDGEDTPARPKKKSHLGLILGILGGVFLICCGGGGLGVWYFGDKVASVAGDGIQNRNNLAEIGLAFQKAHDSAGGFPNDSYDAQGKPLLSWRVHLLPQLGEHELYSQFKLTEPWDGPTNKALLARMPRVFGTSANNAAAGSGKTYYRGFNHPGAMFEKPRVPGNPLRLNIASIVDGTANTILIVEAGEPVEWTRPDNLVWSPNTARPMLGGTKPSGDYFWVVMCNGAVIQVRKAVSDKTLRDLIGRNDGNVIAEGWQR